MWANVFNFATVFEVDLQTFHSQVSTRNNECLSDALELRSGYSLYIQSC
jgi:hypothetical protein